MSKNEYSYLNLCKHVLENGAEKFDRTGTGTISVFGYQARYDLSEGFPLLTTKKIPFNLILSELIWFIKGDTNIRFLLQHNNNIWNEWAFEKWVNSKEYSGPNMDNFGLRSLEDSEFKEIYNLEMDKFKQRILNDDEFAKKYGELGEIYGKQWRAWKTSTDETIDQLKNVVDEIKNNPYSRRHIVSGWNVESLPNMSLPPCHTMFQFYVNDGKLSCQLYQRSGDIFLGVPFNIASYALLTHLIAREADLEVGEFVHTLGDAHIYSNHFNQVKTQLEREPKELPRVVINPELKSIFDIEVSDVEVVGYDPHPGIKAPVAV